ncbi:MAG: SDR family NAD(P)-dependent oxidoreductase, partial [Ferruginibacter sp.]|nr:SDR family NAD(P)-dependent oxidoreductase [Cytophagales bacterium]
MNQTALITGATSGIGRATAETLAGLGFRLLVCGRREDRLRELAAQLQSRTDIHVLCFDVRNREAVNQAV